MAAENARKALELDISLAEAHTSLAFVKLCYDWDAAGADREFRRAIRSNPGYATARHWHAHNLRAMGKLGDALQEMNRAGELDPESLPIGAGVGWCHYYARNYDQAIAQYRETLKMDPNYLLLLSTLGLAYDRKGSCDDAISELSKAVAVAPDNPSAHAGLGHAYALKGSTAQAQRTRPAKGPVHQPVRAGNIVRVPVFGPGRQRLSLPMDGKACAERSDYMM